MGQNAILTAAHLEIWPKIGRGTHIRIHFRGPRLPFNTSQVNGAISCKPYQILLWRIEKKWSSMGQNGILAAARPRIWPKIGGGTHIGIHFLGPRQPFHMVQVTVSISCKPSQILLWRFKQTVELDGPKQNSRGHTPENLAKNRPWNSHQRPFPGPLATVWHSPGRRIHLLQALSDSAVED